MGLQLDNVRLGYGSEPVVHDLSFALREGEIGCLLGESGCGKTTTLRAIAGLEPVRSGTIRIGNRIISDSTRTVAPEKRGVGMVFQDHALFPHLTVAENIAFGLRRLSSARRRERVGGLLKLAGLSSLGERFPHEISGGQQQRVALARALAPEPAILLLDEPFSSLDSSLRRQLGEEVRHMLKSRTTTSLMVTHDQQEAFTLADRVGLMRAGRLLQWDTPYQLYHRPVDRYVAAFTGRGSYLSARVSGHKLLHALGESPLPQGPYSQHQQVDLLIRPDDIRPATNGLSARVMARQFQGAHIFYRLELATGEQIGALFPSHHNHAVNDLVGIGLDARHLIIFRSESSVERSQSAAVPEQA